MHKSLKYIKTFQESPVNVGLASSLVAGFVIAFVLIIQYGFKIEPCELCLAERFPYFVVIVMGLLTAATKKHASAYLAVAGIAMILNVLLSGFHLGVQFFSWQSPLISCSTHHAPMVVSQNPLSITTNEACSHQTYLVHGLPVDMTMLDFVFSIIFAFILIKMAYKFIGFAKQFNSNCSDSGSK